MRFPNWLRKRVQQRSAYQRPAFRPMLERLDERCLPSAGVLDPTFGNGAGYVATTSLSADESWASAVLAQPDGKIVAAGLAQVGTGAPRDDFAVVRYQANGSLDTAFGSGGHALADFLGSYYKKWEKSIANAAALYPQAGTANDGKIVLVGEHWIPFASNFVLARFNANGTLDSTFGSNKTNPGEVTTTFPTTNSTDFQSAFGVVIQPDGKIVAAGIGAGGFVLARYKANGALDASFGAGGEVITPLSGAVQDAGTLLLQPDGKLIVVGEVHPASGNLVVTMARYKSDGSLDTSFGTGGLVTSSVVSSFGVRAALYPPGTANAGEIVVVGQTPGQNLEIARFNTNGALDSTFGAGGTVTGQSGSYASVVIAADGKVVVAYGSEAYANGPYQFGVARFNPDGSPDNAFGTDGYVRSALGGYSAGDANAVALQANGNIVAAGSVFTSAGQALAVARYLPSEPQIGALLPTLNADGSTTVTASSLTDGNPNSTITQVQFYYFDSNGNKLSLGYGASDSTGAWKLTVTLPAGTTLYAQAEDNYGVFGDPLALSL